MSEENETIGTGRAIDRRTMLKAAAAAGVVVGTWVAPRIETLGFAPAAAMTMCVITSPANEDLNANQNNNTYVSSGFTACSDSAQRISFGSSGNAPNHID